MFRYTVRGLLPNKANCLNKTVCAFYNKISFTKVITLCILKMCCKKRFPEKNSWSSACDIEYSDFMLPLPKIAQQIYLLASFQTLAWN
jgi:hypothetical protein